MDQGPDCVIRADGDLLLSGSLPPGSSRRNGYGAGVARAGLSYALPGAGLRRPAWAASAEHFLEESASTGASSSGSRVGCLDRSVVRVHDAELWRPANASREHHSRREGCAGSPVPAAARADYESVCRPAARSAMPAAASFFVARAAAVAAGGGGVGSLPEGSSSGFRGYLHARSL